ncbi:MAG: DUF2835 domain-containing protein [Gammaproteobacteria bacterium]|nr:DUF2835 domain-containing protein [Gammaproteobacteria bacterium]
MEKHLTSTFYLSISPDRYQEYYRGSIKWVTVTDIENRVVRFPANLLTAHITHQGIVGKFILTYDHSGKAISLEKC